MAASHPSPCCPTVCDTSHSSELKEGELCQDERVALDGAVWRKLDKRILPLCTAFYFIAMVDVANVWNVRVAGLQTSLAMSNYQYSIVLTIGYIPFVLSELPATLSLKHVGPDVMLPAMVTLWGVVSVSQGFVTSFVGLMICRLVLGFVGGGLFPCMIFYLSFFYPRKWLQIRIATFFTSSLTSGAVSSLLTPAIERLNGKGDKPGWAWVFILEGIFAFVFGVISFFLLPRSPGTVRFLTKRERAYVVAALKHAGSMSNDDEKDSFTWAEVVKAFKSPHVWLMAITSFFSGTILMGLARLETTIITGLGYAGAKAQLMAAPPLLATFTLYFISAMMSDRYQCRGYTVIFFSLLKMVGFTMFYASTSSHVRYASLFFSLTGSFCVVPARITWLTNNSAPHTRCATAIAMNIIMSELGGVLFIWLFGSLSPAPNYTSATITFITMSICMVVLSGANLVYLRQQNWLKAERKQMTRKEEEPEGLGDRSAWFEYSL